MISNSSIETSTSQDLPIYCITINNHWAHILYMKKIFRKISKNIHFEPITKSNSYFVLVLPDNWRKIVIFINTLIFFTKIHNFWYFLRASMVFMCVIHNLVTQFVFSGFLVPFLFQICIWWPSLKICMWLLPLSKFLDPTENFSTHFWAILKASLTTFILSFLILTLLWLTPYSGWGGCGFHQHFNG